MSLVLSVHDICYSRAKIEFIRFLGICHCCISYSRGKIKFIRFLGSYHQNRLLILLILFNSTSKRSYQSPKGINPLNKLLPPKLTLFILPFWTSEINKKKEPLQKKEPQSNIRRFNGSILSIRRPICPLNVNTGVSKPNRPI